jgi:hypothetical protein
MTKCSAARQSEIDRWAVFFAALAVLLRIVFWAYTGRVWEDSLIALASVQNMWAGLGLTQHVGEARIYSFSSPLNVIVLAIGEWAKHGIAAVQIASLISSAAAILLASAIFRRSTVPLVGRIVCYAYLACDHLQIFFGMGGMETQMATALALALVYLGIERRAFGFGIVSGLAILARLELALVVVFCAVPFIKAVFERGQRTAAFGEIAKSIFGAGLLLAPWTIFTAVYYGSPLPHTVVAKKVDGGPVELAAIPPYLHAFWKQIAPFREFCFVSQTPVPDNVLIGVVALLVVVTFIGFVAMLVDRSPLRIAAVSALCFWAYLIVCHVQPYFMWYTPPFMALTFVTIAYGVSAINRASEAGAVIVAAVLVVAYASHLPFTLPLDRAQQIAIEDNVRHQTGVALRAMMKPGDTVLLEPLGYIGSQVRDRTVYDIPGLASDTVLRAKVKLGEGGMFEAIHPDFMVLRPQEVARIGGEAPGFLDGYSKRATFQSAVGDDLSFHGLTYKVEVDSVFYIYERIKS